MSIFKAYDIRGIVPKDVNEEVAYKLGKAFAHYMNVNKIVVGRDMRLSSDKLFKALAKGICEQGSDVIDIGMVSTPMSYFACNYLRAEAGIMITASHNPKEYNGFKLMRKNAIPIGEDTGIRDIEKLYNDSIPLKNKKGIVKKENIEEAYAKHVLKFIKNKDVKLKIVIDTANGMAGKEVPLVFKHLKNIKVIPMYFEVDGTFPNHEADPLKDKNTIEVQERVVKENAELGIAFDGDADRVFFISDDGDKIPSDYITCLIAENLLKEHPGERILYDLRSSWITKETIEANGGKASMSRVGHAFIKAQLRKEDGIFGGELSGHYYFRDNFYTDSGIIACLMVIDILAEKGKKISELIKPLQKYYASGEINSKVEDKEGVILELSEIYKGGKVSWLDGIKIEFSDWWFNVRPSNTEPLIRLNLEAKSRKQMEEKRAEVLKIIRGKKIMQ